MKSTLWRNIFKSITGSWGRFFSIIVLMALGSFALVGLYVTGPDMQKTGEHLFSQYNAANITISGDYGLDKHDRNTIEKAKGIKNVEYGYLKDTVVKGTKTSVRIFSKPNKVSKYQVVKGRLPKQDNEIALSNKLGQKHKLGSTVNFTEKTDANGEKVLRRHSYKVVGYVNSSEILSQINLGQSTAGSGELKGYAIVNGKNFTSNYYMTARLTFKNMKNLSAYSQKYVDRAQKHRNELDSLLKNNPQKRLTNIKKQYQSKINRGNVQVKNTENKLAAKQQQLNSARQKIQNAKQQVATKQHQINAQLQQNPQAEFSAQIVQGKAQIEQANAQIKQQEQQYQKQANRFAEQKKKAASQIKENRQKLNDAQQTLNSLEKPVYSIDTQQEANGSEGYQIYDTVSRAITSLAKVFPVFLYFVAALVTLATMTRFVEEERIDSGTLKALGYSDYDVIKKFTFYGIISSTIGSAIGIILGHTLLPEIVNHAYSTGFTVPPIELHFYPTITLIALLLGLISAVIPAWWTAKNQLREKTADLLVSEPPKGGSRILLERFTLLWNKMSFSHKITARNIFRYKKRMLMTIFGVSGSVALLFTGFAMLHSISGMNQRQFGDLINYDLIVTKSPNLKSKQNDELNDELHSSGVKKQTSVHYEEMSKVAGNDKRRQTITAIVPQKENKLADYVKLEKPSNHRKINLKNNGVVVSQKLAKLLRVKKGDTITIQDSKNKSHKLKVADITEMYMSHFIFMNKTYYHKAFEKKATANANVVTLRNGSTTNTEKEANKFMKLDGTSGVVQNTSLSNQINTIVSSLNQVMITIIIVAALLAAVILYNLTNINVAERMRELSTIKVLGFYNNEVTMYIYRETIVLSILGIFVGYGFGYVLHQYLLAVIPPDNIMFDSTSWSMSFIIPAAAITIVTVILGFFVNNRLRNVNMLDALQSVD